MEASVLDLRRRMKSILQALDRNEPVTILHRGKKKGVLYPAERQRTLLASQHPAFGMWRHRRDLQDVDAHVRRLRKGRFNAV